MDSDTLNTEGTKSVACLGKTPRPFYSVVAPVSSYLMFEYDLLLS